MIVAVEGPSAAGKTTWCRQHASVLVEEYAPTGVEPDGTDAAYQAAYWVGAAPWSRFEQEFAQARYAFASGNLGFADLVLISIPATAILQTQRDADTSRRRKTFALHSTLAEPLRSWYRAVEALEPGRVVWGLPGNGLPQSSLGPRARRSDPALLDQLMHLLPSQ